MVRDRPDDSLPSWFPGSICWTLRAAADTLEHSGRAAEAAELYAEAVAEYELHEPLCFEQENSFAIVLKNYGRVLLGLGRPDEASSMEERADQYW